MAGLFESSTSGSSLFGNSSGGTSLVGGGASKGGGLFGGSSNKLDLEQNENLKMLAEQEGFKEKKVFNAVDSIARILNFDVAAIAGGIRGAIRPNETFREGVTKGIKENIGYADVIREVVGTPATRAGKIAQGTTGFAADIFLSPLTYLSFGTSGAAKVGGKALTTGAAKLSTTAAKEIRIGAESRAAQFISEGVDPDRALRLAESEAKRDINELYQKITSKEGLTVSNAEKFIEKGLNVGTVESIQQLGKTIYDRGGIKMFGKTLVSSEAIARTPIGQVAKRLGETEIAQAFKNTLGRMFVYNFAKNPEVARLMYRASVTQKRAVVEISEAVDKIFKGTTEEEQVELFERVFDERLATINKASEIETQYLDEFNTRFPDVKVQGKEDATQILAGMEDSVLKETQALRKQIDEVVQPFFEAREKARKAQQSLEASEAGLQAAPAIRSLSKVDELNQLKTDMQKVLSELRKSRKGTGTLAMKSGKEMSIEIGEGEAKSIFNSIVKAQEEKLNTELNNIVDLIRSLKETPVVEKAGNVKMPKIKQATDIEKVAILEKRIQKLQTDMGDQVATLQKVLDSKRLAKNIMRGKRLLFPNSPKLQSISDLLFEGDTSVVAKMAEAAGISEADAYKFYLPSIFQDKIRIKQFASGMSSPKMDFLKEFHGKEGENQIRNSAEALKRGRIQVVTARIKSDTIKAMFGKGGIGIPIKDMSEAEAARLGYVKMTRNLIDGKFEGWIPKAIKQDIDEFFEPRANLMDDLGRATGFDWATGIFKGWVTSLFPAFHFRNMTSNQFQLMLKFGMESTNPQVHKEALDFLVSNAMGKGAQKNLVLPSGEKITYKGLLQKIRNETDFLDKGAFSDVEMMLKEINPSKVSWNPLSRQFVLLERGREIGTAIENYSKMVGVIAGLKQGKSVKEAVAAAEEALFNYGKLTPFEKDVMRRLIPFYTWARKNFEYQIRTLASNPGRTAAQVKFLTGIENSFGEPSSPSDKEGLPSWIIDRLGIKGSSNKYLTGFGLPIEEFMSRFSGDKGFIWNTMANTMSQMNPLIKYNLETVTGVDLFQGRPITEITNGNGLKPMIDVMPKPVAKEFKELIQYKAVTVPRYVNGVKIGEYTKYTANPFALHFFRNLPTARLQQTMEFASDPQQKGLSVLARWLTGVSTFTIDKEQTKFFKDLEQKEQLVDFLKRMGIIGVKDVIYQKD